MVYFLSFQFFQIHLFLDVGTYLEAGLGLGVCFDVGVGLGVVIRSCNRFLDIF